MTTTEMDTSTCDAVLPPGLERQEGTPPVAPASFDDGYVLPQHTEKPLQRLFPHSLDEHLVFYEKPHVYTWKEIPTSASVTALAHEYERPFVALDAIQSMKTGRSQAWPRLEYVTDAKPIQEWTPRRGALVVFEGKTVAVVHPHSTHGANVSALRTLLQKSMLKGCSARVEGDQNAELFSYEREMTPVEIMEAWNCKGKRASHMGTEAHYQAELMFNGLPFRWWEPESQVVVDFARDHMVPKGMYAVATEKEIVCVDADLAGSIDLIVYEPSTKLYHIIDHKRTDKLQRDLRGYGKMKTPFEHLDDCKGCAYALQTSIYQFILERDYGMEIGERVLLSLHPDRPFVTTVPYMRAEVEFIMRKRFELVRARRRVADSDPERFRCSLCGAPAVDAVRLADSDAVAMEKAALVDGRRYHVDSATRAEFEARVAQELPAVELARVDCVAWKKRMPEHGLRPFE